MEEETFFSGYCRQIDQTRMVAVLKENGQLSDVDCNYEDCIYCKACTIGQAITQWLSE